MKVGLTGTYRKDTKTYHVNGHVLTVEEAECIATLYRTVTDDTFSNMEKDKLHHFETWNKGK